MLIIINRKKKKEKKTMFLSKISIHLGIMILYTIEKKIFFAVVLYKLLVQKKYENVILKTALKLMANKIL